jgi:hypothetical protein
MPTLPSFTRDGLLPPGDYELTIEELKQSILVRGPRMERSKWNSLWRLQLVENLENLVLQLQAVGITEIFADGSFTEDKEHPVDIDGYFNCNRDEVRSGRLQRRLNKLDAHAIWTWDSASRRPFPGYPKGQLPMWHRYRVELYPNYGQFSGIVDENGVPLDFPAAFRRSRRSGRSRGIIKIGV